MLRDWVVRDVETGAESSVRCRDEEWCGRGLAMTFGMDTDGRTYGLTDGVIGRMTPAGVLDWQLPVGGIAVSHQHGSPCWSPDRTATER